MTGMRALLVSTYDLGHQPFGLASPAAWLRRDGVHVDCADLAREPLDEDVVRRADLIAFHLPMHTATRMAAGVIKKVRGLNATARLAAYGLYAPLNAEMLAGLGVEAVVGGLFALIYGLWYMLPRHSVLIDGVHRGVDWTTNAGPTHVDWTTPSPSPTQ